MTDMSPYEPYQVHLADVSYFSGKLEAYLRYKEIPFQRVEMTAAKGVSQIYANTGVRKVPAVESANGLWFRETTNMIDWFEQHYPDTGFLPVTPSQAFICALIEDYVDEWCWRAAMYWRWKFDDNARFVASRIGREVFADWPIPTSCSGAIFKARQRFFFMRNDGVTKNTESFVKQHYIKLSESLSLILEQQPFLLGARPTLVDIAFMGPFFRHYFCDPVPAQVMRDQFPQVLAWVSRVWNTTASQLQATEISSTLTDFSNPGWKFILSEIMQDYLPYLHQNKQAWQQGKKRFDNQTSSTCFPNVPVVHHRVYCLEQLEEKFQKLDSHNQQAVSEQLDPFGVSPIHRLLGGQTTSGLTDSYTLPLKPRPPIGLAERVEAYVFGSPWDMNRPPKSEQKS